jgi:hypothetical protein
MSTKVRERQKLSVIESVYAPPGRVDREAGVIHGVKILGRSSVNGREYSEPALRDAADRYEGMRVNIDHPDKKAIKAARGTLEQWGWLEGIEVRDDGVFGDLHFLKTHPHTEPLLELAERRPDKFGLSHNADCSGFHNGKKQVIESVDHVRSVDVVQRPATTQGLFEHYEERDMLKKTLKQLLESAPEGTRGRRALLRVLEMDGMADMGATPVAVDPSDTSEDQVWAGFRAAVIAVLDDDSLDVATTRDQIMTILDNYSDAFGNGDSSSDAAASDDSADASAVGNAGGTTTEGIDELRRAVKLLRSEGKARDLLEQHDIQATSGRIKGLVSVLESANDLHDLLSSFPKRSGFGRSEQPLPRVQKPRKSAPLMEGELGAGKQSALPYKDHKDLARMIR